MASRILMHVAGRVRPLTLGAAGEVKPTLNSSDTPWQGLPLELHTVGSARRRGDVGAVGAVGDDRGLLVILEGRIELVLRDGQREIRAVGRPGSVSWISSERRRHVVTVTGSARALAVNIPRPWFARMDIDEPPDELTKRAPLAPDETLHNLAQCMRAEVAAGAPTGRVFAESLSCALLSYLVDRVPLPAARERVRVRGRLSESQCRRLRAYIGENLARQLGVVEPARRAAVSGDRRRVRASRSARATASRPRACRWRCLRTAAVSGRRRAPARAGRTRRPAAIGCGRSCTGDGVVRSTRPARSCQRQRQAPHVSLLNLHVLLRLRRLPTAERDSSSTRDTRCAPRTAA